MDIPNQIAIPVLVGLGGIAIREARRALAALRPRIAKPSTVEESMGIMRGEARDLNERVGYLEARQETISRRVENLETRRKL